jgi:hypothetical protein
MPDDSYKEFLLDPLSALPELRDLFSTQRRKAARTQRKDRVSFGLRQEAKRHAAFTVLAKVPKRCRRYALPPHSKMACCFAPSRRLLAPAELH